MADPMDYTMDDGPTQSAHISNPPPQCPYQPPHLLSNPNSFTSQPHDAHHYDPVHNTESWHANGRGLLSRHAPPYPPLSASTLPSPTYGSWQGYSDVHRGSQGPGLPAYPQQPGFMGAPHSPWGEPRGYDSNPASFAYTPGMYGENGAPSGPSHAARNALTASMHSQTSPMRRYPTVAHLPDDYIRRAPRTREEALRNYARLREEREAAGLPPNPLLIPGSYDYLSTHPLDTSHTRRHDNPDWDSEDDDDSLAAPDSESYPYRAGLIFNGGMDEERRMAAARGALAAAKKVPSKEFVATLEKLDPKDLKEADRTCMICYNEFGISNPDGVVEQPIRLPKCKHLFGDKCIKKWFEDSDSCPYCRDKLPSEQIHRKHPPIDHLYHAQSRRVHIAAAAAAQAHSSRARALYPSRASDEPNYGNSSQYFRHSQEEYHYIMRGSGAPDAWSHSPPRARDSENRRRQARGRAGLGRPTSVSSARLVAPIPPNAQRGQLQSITPNTVNSIPTTTSHGSISPGLTRQHSTGSILMAGTPPRSRLSSASSPSSEEASPPVAVGSGIAAGDHHSSPSGSRSYRDYVNNWADPFHSYVTPNEHVHNPGRTPNSRADMEHSGPSIEGRSPGTEYTQRHGEIGLIGRSLNGNRWSR